jgi:hypothetical protein
MLGVSSSGVVPFENRIENEPDAFQCARTETSRPEKPLVIGTSAGMATL